MSSAGRFRFGLALLTIAGLPAPGLATSTVDFETPDLGGDSWQVISPFQAGGVTFTSSAPVGLVRECALTITRAGACGPCENQWLGSAAGPDCPVGVYEAPLRADFQPEAGAVRSVSVVVQTLSYSTLVLELYNPAGVLVGGGQSPVALAYEGCGSTEDGDMTSRGTVHADASEAVAYAVVWVAPGWQCPGIPGCYISCNPFAIDDFTYGPGVVPTRVARWGALKLRYR